MSRGWNILTIKEYITYTPTSPSKIALVYAQNFNFPGAKSVINIVFVFLCYKISKKSNTQGAGMGSHMPPVGKQRHRIKNHPKS